MKKYLKINNLIFFIGLCFLIIAFCSEISHRTEYGKSGEDEFVTTTVYGFQSGTFYLSLFILFFIVLTTKVGRGSYILLAVLAIFGGAITIISNTLSAIDFSSPFGGNIPDESQKLAYFSHILIIFSCIIEIFEKKAKQKIEDKIEQERIELRKSLRKKMKIRKFKSEDTAQLLQIMESNMPEYFASHELAMFENYLKKDSEHFFVLEDEGEIRAGAGVNFGMFEDAGLLSWGMVHADFHGKKYGSELLKYRLNFIRETTSYKKVIVRTSQLVDPFFRKFNFQETLRKENFWGDGLDLVQMEFQYSENDFFL